MAIPLILADDDMIYVNRVAEWLLVHPESGFLPIVAGTCLPDPMQQGMGTPVVLFGGAYWKEIIGAANGIHAIQLQDERDDVGGSIGRNIRRIPSVIKFQPLSGLMKDIMAVAAEYGWIPATRIQAGRIPLNVTVHLSGAVHLHPIAPVLAVLNAHVRKTLYLDLDPAGHCGTWFPPGGGHGLSRLAYYVHNGSKGWEDRFENCLFQDAVSGVHTLREPDLPEDAAGLGAEEVSAIHVAAGSAGFGMLIVDAGLGLDRRNLSLLPAANRAFLVCGNDMPGLRHASAASSLLGRTSDGLQMRESAEIIWIFCGGGKMSGHPDIPPGQAVHVLPEAYPDGFPQSGWEMNQGFLSGLSAFASVNGIGLPSGGSR